MLWKEMSPMSERKQFVDLHLLQRRFYNQQELTGE